MVSKLLLQHGDGLKLTSLYTCKHPTLKEVIELQADGNNKYMEYISILTSTSLDIADVLWEEYQIWYEDITDEWKFFIEKSCIRKEEIGVYKIYDNGLKTIIDKTFLIDKTVGRALGYFLNTSDTYAIIVKDNLMFLANVEKDNNKLYHYTEKSLVLNNIFYEQIKEYLSAINWMDKKDYDVVHGGNKYANKYILKMEYKKRLNEAKNKRKQNVTLDSIVSSLIAKGASYKEIYEYPIYMVYDQFYRYIQFANWDNTTQALYSGNMDTKKHPVNWDKINWSRVL